MLRCPLTAILDLTVRGVAAHHQEQTASFLRFAAYKREQHVGEIDAAFEETVDTRCAPAASLSLGARERA